MNKKVEAVEIISYPFRYKLIVEKAQAKIKKEPYQKKSVKCAAIAKKCAVTKASKFLKRIVFGEY